MKTYEIYDEENKLHIGVLIYYEKAKRYIIELQKHLDEWSSPLLFSAYVKNGIYTIPEEISYMWVKERVIPSGRQNISSILSTHKLKEYDEMKFLELSMGKCSQDAMCIRKIDELPEYVNKRAEKNVSECFIIGEEKIICVFANGKIKKIDLQKFKAMDGIDKVIKNQNLFQTVKVGTGGYSIVFNDAISLSARSLYAEGELIPLSMRDLVSFVTENIIDTSEACNVLECSRQNIAYLSKENHLHPIKENVKGNLFLRGDILKNKW